MPNYFYGRLATSYRKTKAMAKKKAKKKTGCNCIKQLNKELEKKNAYLRRELLVNFKTGKGTMSSVVIETCKDDTKKRKPKPTVFAVYCPFCGVKLEVEDG